jgi:hypothetical protein
MTKTLCPCDPTRLVALKLQSPAKYSPINNPSSKQNNDQLLLGFAGNEKLTESDSCNPSFKLQLECFKILPGSPICTNRQLE